MLYPVMFMDLLYTLSHFSVIDWLLWGLTILSLIGTVMNVKKMQDCFYIWAFTNVLWSIYDYSIKEYQQSLLFFIYFILALWGIYEWRARKYVMVKEGINDRNK
jgi:nicotinamide riboside transporter PnuC